MHECANCSCGNMTAKQFAVLFSFCRDEREGSGRGSTGEAGEKLSELNHGEKAANALRVVDRTLSSPQKNHGPG